MWRRLLVRSHTPLAELHEILQRAMGWWDCHLHQFRVGPATYAPSQPGGYGPRPKDESRARLAAVAPTGTRFVYEYDFGDGWEHTINVEKVMPATDGHVYPCCVGGAQACPPEDCGGWWGYAELVNTLKSGSDEQRDEMIEWLGGDYDPDHFDLAGVNAALSPLGGKAGQRRGKRTAMVTNT